MKKIIVTRHMALVEYMRGLGIVGPETPVIQHAMPEDIRGMHVFGVLPLRLAAAAGAVTEIPLAVEHEDRGRELTLGRLREIAGKPMTYHVFTEESVRRMARAIDCDSFYGLGGEIFGISEY